MKTQILLFAAAFLLSACQARNTPVPASAAQNLPVATTPAKTTQPLEPTSTPIAPAETPAPAGLAVTQAQDIQGVWTITTHPHYKQAYWLVQENGTYKFSPNADGGRPSESGKYWFKDGLFFVTDDFCPKPGKYEVQRTEGQAIELLFKLVDDTCSGRVKILTGAVATWYQSLQ